MGRRNKKANQKLTNRFSFLLSIAIHSKTGVKELTPRGER